MSMCSVPEILRTSVEGLKSSAAAKDIALGMSIQGTVPDVWGDASRLQQVADNLISNAIKFTDRGGHVEVCVEEKGDLVQVSVIDTGPGLSTDEQSKVFDMFYQADASARRSAGGAGLGLAIARGIVTMHGGEIGVRSEKGKGSTFSFMVPRSKAQKAA
jgi:signal transduction histidine kinase